HAWRVAAADGNRQIEPTFRIGSSLNDFAVILQEYDFCIWNSITQGIDYSSMQTAIGLTLCRKRTQSGQKRAAQKYWKTIHHRNRHLESSFALERADCELGGTGLLTRGLL